MSKDDLDFMDELEAATRLKPSEGSHYLLLAVFSLVLAFFIWSGTSEIEELTRGSGQVVPTQEIQIVQSLDGGILKELLVAEGQSVKKDDILLKVSDVAFASEERGVEAKTSALKAKRTRLMAEAESKALKIPSDIQEKHPDIARNEKALFNSRREELRNAKSILDNEISSARSRLGEVQAKINRLIESRSLLQKELDITREMVARRAVPKLEEIRLDRELANISGQIREASQEKNALNSDLRTKQKERKDREDQFKSQVLGELNEVESQISQLTENLMAIGDRVSRTEVRSPVDGVINKISLKTVGGIVEPAMKLFEVVPLDNNLKIMARVTPQEIAFIRPNLPVNIKISAYDPQRYGSLDGTLSRIGANSITDEKGNIFFEVEVKADQNYLGTSENPLPITPGMVADIEVITGKRSILSYLAKPVLRAKDRALSER